MFPVQLSQLILTSGQFISQHKDDQALLYPEELSHQKAMNIINHWSKIIIIDICVFLYWRGEAQEAAGEEEATKQGPSDPEAEDQAADPGEDADGQGRRHRSVRSTHTAILLLLWLLVFVEIVMVVFNVISVYIVFIHIYSHQPNFLVFHKSIHNAKKQKLNVL